MKGAFMVDGGKQLLKEYSSTEVICLSTNKFSCKEGGHTVRYVCPLH